MIQCLIILLNLYCLLLEGMFLILVDEGVLVHEGVLSDQEW